MILAPRKICEVFDIVESIISRLNPRPNSVDQILLERAWTEILQSFVEYGNLHCLKNFQYRLTLDEDESALGEAR